MEKKLLKKIYNTEFFKLPRNCFYRLLQRADLKELSISKLRDIILSCPILTFAVLKFANSKEFGFSGKILTITESLSLLELPVAKNYLISFKEYENEFKSLNICKRVLSVARKVKRFVLKNKIKQWELFCIIVLLKEIAIILYINFFRQHNYTRLIQNKENINAIIMKKCNFPILYYHIYKNSNGKKYKWLKEFISIAFKYHNFNYARYVYTLEKEIPDIIEKLRQWDKIKEVG